MKLFKFGGAAEDSPFAASSEKVGLAAKLDLLVTSRGPAGSPQSDVARAPVSGPVGTFSSVPERSPSLRQQSPLSPRRATDGRPSSGPMSGSILFGGAKYGAR